MAEKEEILYTITIRVQSPEKYNEVLPDDLQTTEILVENVISQALLELFEVVIIEDITINHSLLHDRPFPTPGSSELQRPM